MPTGRGVKRRVWKRELLEVHHLEGCVWDPGPARQRDHSFREVHTDERAVGPDQGGKGPDQGGKGLAQRARTAREVQDAHARLQLQQLHHSLPAKRFLARHDAVQPLLVRGGVPAEHRGEQVFRLHPLHSLSNQAAARRVSELVRPATWMPTGSPPTGTGTTATGWSVVLKGRVKRDSGSRTSWALAMGGATIAVAGRISASTCSIARSASAWSRVRSRSASS